MDLKFSRDAALLAIIVAAFALMCLLFWGCFADDAFIVARYAANVLRGNGLVYNTGEHVDALTSPLHLLLLLPFQALFPNAIKAYAVACAIFLPLVMVWAGSRIFTESAKQRLFYCCVLLFPPCCFWTIGGLETPVLAMVIAALAVLQYTRPSGSAVAVLSLCAVAVLTRYDAAVLVAPCALHTLYVDRRRASAWVAASVLCGILLAWFAGSYLWFGDILPTSFYTKNPAIWTLGGIARGAVYELSLLVLFCIPLAAAYGRSRKSGGGGRSAADWSLILGLVLYFVYGLAAGTVHMMYLYRLFVPCLPWLGVLLIRRVRTSPPTSALIAIVALQIALASLIYFKALNFNLTLILWNQSPFNQWFEFSTIGAVVNRTTDELFARQADAVRAHWRRQPESAQGIVPRLHSITEGQPPYELQDFYVFGPLVGYRSDCRVDTIPASHYLQHFGWIDEHGVEMTPWRMRGWQLVVGDDVPVEDWSGARRALRIQWFYQPNPQPNRLPAAIHGACLP